MKTQKFFIALLLVTMIPANAQRSEESIRAAIENQVSQRHPSIPAGFWEGLGPEALPVIKKMYAMSESANEKTFLIDGLSHFHDSATGSFLEGEATSTQNEVLKKKLLGAVIQSEGERGFDFVEPYLKDSDGHIRTEVARGLMAYSDSNAQIRKRLQEFRANEKTPWVLAELDRAPVEGLQKTRQQVESNPGKGVTAVGAGAGSGKTASETSAVKSLPPLPEKSWAGVWRGSYVTDKQVMVVEANLSLVDAAAKPMKWKVEYKLPKLPKQEWKTGEFTLNYFQTNRAHWMELRNPKMDIVFLAQKKVN